MKTIVMTGALLVSLVCISACDDKLSALPTQAKVEGNLIVDQPSAEVALNGIYYMYAECGIDYYDVPSTRCAMKQEVYPADFCGLLINFQGAIMMEDHTQKASSSYVGLLWGTFYSQLAAANGVIQQLEAASDHWFSGNRKNEIMAEARFMRALIHYNLMRWFAQYWKIDSPYGVLLRSEPAKAGTVPKDRSTVKESYDYILNDLEYAITNIVKENDNHYANAWVAKGLKVRVLMMRGQGSDYADAAALADDIIKNSPYELEANLKDIFRSKGLNSKEIMFGIQPKAGQTDVYNAYNIRGVSQYYPTDRFMTLFENDPRKDWMFLIKESKDYYGNPVVSKLICKHIDPNNVVANTLEESQYQMRLTEMYLLRAEALVYAGNREGAKTLLKEVMEHAGLTDFSAVDNATTNEALLKELFNETLKNLFCESGRELEIMMRMPKSIVSGINSFCEIENVMIFPIPAAEFKYNKLLKEQNPGYGKE